MPRGRSPKTCSVHLTRTLSLARSALPLAKTHKYARQTPAKKTDPIRLSCSSALHFVAVRTNTQNKLSPSRAHTCTHIHTSYRRLLISLRRKHTNAHDDLTSNNVVGACSLAPSHLIVRQQDEIPGIVRRRRRRRKFAVSNDNNNNMASTAHTHTSQEVSISCVIDANWFSQGEQNSPFPRNSTKKTYRRRCEIANSQYRWGASGSASAWRTDARTHSG